MSSLNKLNMCYLRKLTKKTQHVKKKTNLDCGSPLQICHIYAGGKCFRWFFAFFPQRAGTKRMQDWSYLAARLSVSLCQSISQSVSQSVFLFIRTCQLEELRTIFCDILYVLYVTGDGFSSVDFNFLWWVINEWRTHALVRWVRH
jgi:hypothetical protein